ncbi:MAG: hypothetical protein RR961_10680 [Eubacterium sp.]
MIYDRSKLQIPSELEALSYTPIHYYNFELAREKKLTNSDNFSQKYLTLQMIYKCGLIQYLTDILMLDEYEKEIKESPLQFMPYLKEEQSIYQKYNMMNFEFIYLRNNLYIEKLEEDDIKTLEFCANKKEYESDALLELVARTCQESITIEDPSINAKKFHLIYENRINGIKSAQNNAVILEIATSSAFDENDNYISL